MADVPKLGNLREVVNRSLENGLLAATMAVKKGGGSLKSGLLEGGE
jgi:hypothetical protein